MKAVHRSLRLASIALLVTVGGTVLASCGATKHTSRDSTHGDSINVAIVDTPNVEDLAHLTSPLFTSKTHITVHYTILDEGTLRELVSSDLAAGGHQFDVVMIGPYEAPQYAKDGYIIDLASMASSDRAYELGDIIPSIRTALSYRGRLYASPFYGESSFLMYRKDVLKAAGIEMPSHPTWQQVAAIARRINRPGMAGICLRGKPGWGELGATFTTVLNTFGGTWWSAKANGSVDKAMVDQPQFRRALQFYVDLVKDAGEGNAASSSFNECLERYLSGRVAMWYDATVGAGLLEASDSPVKGRTVTSPRRSSGRRRRDGSGPGRSRFLRPRASGIWPGGTSPGPQGRSTSRRPGRESPGAGRRSRRALAAPPTRFRRTGRRLVCSPRRRSKLSSLRRSTIRVRPGAPELLGFNTSAFRSSRPSATNAPSSSLPRSAAG